MSAIISTKDLQVTIGTTHVDEILDNPITKFTIPKTTSNQSKDEGANVSKYINLLQGFHLFDIDGVVTDDVGYADTSSSAYGKKEDLKTIFTAGVNPAEKDSAGRSVTLTYPAETTQEIAITKLSIGEDPVDQTTGGGTAQIYTIKIGLFVGSPQ